jgi:hypothetical protein
LPSPIIGTQGGPNPITLQDQIQLQAFRIDRYGWAAVGRVTYGKVSILGREVSVPHGVSDIEAPTPMSGDVTIKIFSHVKVGGEFVHGPYNPANGLFITKYPNDVSTLNTVTLTSAAAVTGFDLNYYKGVWIQTSEKKQLRKFHSQKRHI